jgi:hypothetical protein
VSRLALLAAVVWGVLGCSRQAVSALRADAGSGAPGLARQGAPAPFAAQFDELTTRFAEVYPSFPYKGMDWAAQSAAFRGRAVRARSQDEFIAVVREMLEPLHDLHIWFVDPHGVVVPTYRPRRTANFDHGRWERALRDANYTARGSDIGDATVGGYGYLYLGSWKSPVDASSLDLALARMRDAPGLILDLRVNAGGNDATALAFVSRFTTGTLVASSVRTRNGPSVTDLDAGSTRIVGPRGAWQFTRPVVIIAGRGGFSATESFVAAMRTLPHVTVIGDTTGGASGNPATFPLGNGWQFTVPRWMEFGPDREPIEGRGVAPHIVIPWTPAGYDRERDPLIDAAVGLLGEINGVYRMAPAGSRSERYHEANGRERILFRSDRTR